MRSFIQPLPDLIRPRNPGLSRRCLSRTAPGDKMHGHHCVFRSQSTSVDFALSARCFGSGFGDGTMNLERTTCEMPPSRIPRDIYVTAHSPRLLLQPPTLQRIRAQLRNLANAHNCTYPQSIFSTRSSLCSSQNEAGRTHSPGLLRLIAKVVSNALRKSHRPIRQRHGRRSHHQWRMRVH